MGASPPPPVSTTRARSLTVMYNYTHFVQTANTHAQEMSCLDSHPPVLCEKAKKKFCRKKSPRARNIQHPGENTKKRNSSLLLLKNAICTHDLRSAVSKTPNRESSSGRWTHKKDKILYTTTKRPRTKLHHAAGQDTYQKPTEQYDVHNGGKVNA